MEREAEGTPYEQRAPNNSGLDVRSRFCDRAVLFAR